MGLTSAVLAERGPLTGMSVEVCHGPSRVAEIAAEHLRLFGACVSMTRFKVEGVQQGYLRCQSSDGATARCDLSWLPQQHLPGSEAVVQALSGMMQVHGRESGRPTPLKLELATVASAIVAVQGLLAAYLSANRGGAGTTRVSVLESALCFTSHYFAYCSHGEGWKPPKPEAWHVAAPPFRAGDGTWFELETLCASDWCAFWQTLGIDRRIAGKAWDEFRLRYHTATCRLPRRFSDAVARCPYPDVCRSAEATGVVVCDVGRGDAFHIPMVPPFAFTTFRGALPAMLPASGQGRALAGLRVVELTKLLQGPLCGFQLADLGADVLHITGPGTGWLRDATPREVGAFSFTYHRNKRQRELDLKSTEGRRALAQELSEADVFLTNLRGDCLMRLGLTPERLEKLNPRLVYAHAGAWGPLAHGAPAYATDYLVQARLGLGACLRPSGASPLPSRLVFTDVIGGLLTCEGILAALCARQRSGFGGHVSTSLLGAGLHVGYARPPRSPSTGESHDLPSWLAEPILANDRPVVTGVRTASEFVRFCDVCGMRPKAGRPDVRHRLKGKSAAAWVRELRAAGIAAAELHGEVDGVLASADVGPHLERYRDAWVARGPIGFGSRPS